MTQTTRRAGKGNGCPLYKACGGCQLQNLSYPEQLQYKQVKCIRYLSRFGHVDEIIGMALPLHYRNKVQAAFGMHRGRIVSGVYQSKSHRIVCVDDCKLEDETADAIIVTIRDLLPRFKLFPYNEDTGKGFLRHVLVKRGFRTGEVMVVLVTPTNLFPKKDGFLNELLRRHPEITTVIQSINGAKTSLVLGKEERVLFGKGYIEDVLCGCRFRISARSFYQINPVQTEVLYGKAMEFAALTGKETVLDAYCGIGTIGLVAAKGAKRVIGVELNADAVRDAKQNAKLNGADNARFFCADAGQFMTEAAKAGDKVDVVFMDPPRAGSDLPFLKSVAALAPNRIVYISCNPETQARDLAVLCKNGYRVEKMQPVDMFPHTGHVECVVLLSQRRATEHIDIKLDLTDLDLTAAETKPTYDDIKAYVLKTYGLKVSALYISQVKRKLGLEVGEAYNKPKSDKSKTPQCPEEKERGDCGGVEIFQNDIIRTFDKPPCFWYNQASKFKEVVFMKKHIYDERNGLHYTLHGDVYLPDLVASEKEYPPLGKYGRMRKTYLQEHHKLLYSRMLRDGSLWQHLQEIDEQAQSTVDTIIASMAEVDGVTEELKATDPMRWVGLMNNYRHCAEELVIREIVY